MFMQVRAESSDASRGPNVPWTTGIFGRVELDSFQQVLSSTNDVKYLLMLFSAASARVEESKNISWCL